MNHQILRSILACPKCHAPLRFAEKSAACTKCKSKYHFEDGIWQLLHITNDVTKKSQSQYDDIFSSDFGGPADGSYKLLSAFAKGKRSVDIGCGTGIVLTQSPFTVGVDFSFKALKHARKNNAKFLIQADAHTLPFRDNAFEVAISAGNLEHFADPQLAMCEMARISKMQMMIVHKYPPVPFAPILFSLISQIFDINHQPIEKPLSMKQIEDMCANAKLKVVFKGVWTLPLNYGKVISFLPEFKSIPSAWFLMTIKK